MYVYDEYLSKLKDKYIYMCLWNQISTPEYKITGKCVDKYEYMREKHIYVRKTCNVWIQHEEVYICVLCNYLWLFGNMSVYKSDYVRVKYVQAQKVTYEKRENEYGKYSSCVK